MEESTRLADSTLHRRKRVISQNHPIYVDDESSTDSGCSSRGSSESNERLSRRGSVDHPCDTAVVEPHGTCYLNRLRGQQRQSSTSQSQERLSSITSCPSNRNSRSKSSRSWSPSEERGNHHHHHHHHHHQHHHSNHHHHHHHRHHSRESPSHSLSPSDAHSSDSDSLKRPSKTEVIRRALQCLKIAKWQENGNNNNSSNESGANNNAKEKKQTKKSPRRILRDPVSYTYVRGLSGLPTQRVPRSQVQQVIAPCSCHDTVGLYR